MAVQLSIIFHQLIKQPTDLSMSQLIRTAPLPGTRSVHGASHWIRHSRENKDSINHGHWAVEHEDRSMSVGQSVLATPLSKHGPGASYTTSPRVPPHPLNRNHV